MLLVADNLQLTRPSLARELATRDAAALGARVQALVAAGAEAIDISTGPLGRQAEKQMVFCLETVAAATDRPLLIDPVVAPLSWQDATAHNRALLQVLQRLPDMLGFDVKTAASLSNLTTGPTARRHKEKLAQAFIPMLHAHGLSMLLVNMNHKQSVSMVRVCRWILDEGVFAWQQVEALDNQLAQDGGRNASP